MKKLALIILSYVLIQFSALGQVVFPEVFSSLGGAAKNSSVHLTFTIGEPLYETVTNNSSILTQGFNQITSKVTDVSEIQTSDFVITAFPNPTSNILNLKIQSDKFKGLDLLVIDLQGRVLLSQTIKSTLTPVSLADFSAGIYFLKLLDKGKLVTIIKIQKINEI